MKTVSNVVNGYAFVGTENRRRVEEALAATGYRPNIGARNLRRGRTGFVALVLPDLGIPYFGELAALTITAARRHDWNVLIEQTQGNREGERASLATLPHLVHGAIVSPEALAAEDFAGPPARPAAGAARRARRGRAVRPGGDRQRAGRPHRRRAPGRVGAPPDRRDRGARHPRHRRPRLAGYRAALTTAGLSVSDGLVATVTAYHRRDGADAMRSLLRRAWRS